ncbi:oligosaccharide repeat unit polymerase [Bacillus mesophilus]|uniref:Oligosaccharide repeat unit polymerase n=1 Tax=Bacillus mesophilus TaxID=1808955 RepID=A0A6M0Q7I0_9BACI|nr:O-antigen polymerase [Bacillus mesophilus]MBM7661615.1 oligosaccharide repeat unit polymerase [Bacillus mesophilus]NEY72284.1 oligosaccharide repeat unit polymerase [Bacillus mesophilus]
MLSLLFIFGFFLILFILFILTIKSNINLLIPTIPSVFIWSYIVFAYIGIMPLFFFWNDYRYAIGINDQEKILMLWGYSSLSILIVTSVFFFMSNVLNIKLVRNYKDSKVVLNRRARLGMYFLFILSLGVLFSYISQIPAIPLIEQFKGATSEELAKFRSMATNAFSGGLHWYRLFYSSVLTFISYYAFSLVIKEKTIVNWTFFLMTFLVTSFASLMSTAKAPFIWYVMGLVIVYLISKRKVIGIKAILLIGGIASISLIIMYKKFMGLDDRPLSDIFMTIFSRTFTGQISPAYFYIEMFPNYEDFLLGKSLPNIGGIFPYEPYRITVEVMNYMHPTLSEKGVVGSAPTVFWAEMYANFGFAGIVITSLVVGVLLYLLQFIIFKLSFNPITVAYVTFLILKFKDLALTGFGRFIFDIDIIVLTMFTAILLLLNMNLRQLINNIKGLNKDFKKILVKESIR